MKLIRFGAEGNEKAGLQLDDKRIDISTFGEDYNERFFETDGLNRLKDWLKTNESNCPIVNDSVRLGSPIARPSKLVCVGLNYAKHAEEAGMTVPKEPVLFFKSTTAIVGPNDDVVIPKNSTKTDWEVELAIVIGKKASYVNLEDAEDYIAGYVLHNDVSERAFQIEKEGQWCKGKGCDTFAPLGPFLATKEEIKDPNNLELWLEVNGERLQHSSTSDFIFNVQEVVSYISQYMTLLPGDVISTGTPFGVGLGFNPPKYLKAGDVMRLGIEGLGVSEQKAIDYK
ncbi:fumarylacetoacetate hydrolase family protein [Polaribacter cellanae]|uniref:Fumarylacetoacetate hydrolase family protein n=1 Tax=Polaribacter cellanae TaxID=2818493 RepID=A0A975CP03_9FLAO|nr:fumarylacetoacetate hydrolase family protein [Polaribacter cellanae]QTE22597.1 fumarylacetoacetate hydrolase family protein [Polaribacter cellanae]